MARIVYRGMACADCASIIANDEDSGIPNPAAHREAMALHSDILPAGNIVVSCDGEDEHRDISSVVCDTCGTRLAGHRCPIVILAD